MVSNGIKYITRKWVRSLILLFIIFIMTSFAFLSFMLKNGTNEAKKEALKNIQNSFSMEINRRYNMGTSRGAGNLKGEDIKKITDLDEVDSYVKRINVVADLKDTKLFQTEETMKNLKMVKPNFRSAAMITGINDAEKEKKFVSGAFKLESGKFFKNGEDNKAIVHEDFAKLNNLKLGDKFKLKSNIYDGDNIKGANEEVELEIVGLFSGKNKAAADRPQLLYENEIITDIKSAAKLYGYTENNAIYQDASFFVRGDKNIDDVLKKVAKLDVDWKSYSILKSENNFPNLTATISGIYKVSNMLLVFGFIIFGSILSLLIVLWTNGRKKEAGIMISLGKTKGQIITQFIAETIIVLILAFVLSFGFSKFASESISNKILKKESLKIEKEINKSSKKTNVSGGAELDGLNKNISSITPKIYPKNIILIFVLTLIITNLSILGSSFKYLMKNPRDLLKE